jgi:dihydrofolate reductase
VARIVVTNHITLDGVMQAPARPDEDTRNGFTAGGWAGERANDPVISREMGKGMAAGGALLFGRRTYEDFAAIWPNRTDNPFTERLTASTKYVVSRTRQEPLPWENSILLPGEAAETVAALKPTLEGNLAILGSGELVHSLARHDLIDEYTLLIHPIVLGKGLRIFPEGAAPAAFHLTDCVPATTGVIIARYTREG